MFPDAQNFAVGLSPPLTVGHPAMTDQTHLTPTAYHREVRDYLRENERDLWAWFATEQRKENYAEELRDSLLKSTYRLSSADHPDLYQQLTTALGALGLEIPVTLYQAQTGPAQPNATLFHLPSEAHIVLSGPIVSLLAPVEWVAVFGHELAHRLLWQVDDGDYLIADRILEATANDPRARSAHVETARRYRLHTEIFADRGALRAAGDLPQTVSALVKISTGLSVSRGESYLTQAAEIFAKGEVRTAALSHPEMFMRTHALALWAEGNDSADTALRPMIAGEISADNLDLLDQRRLSELTRRFLAQLLRPAWFRSDAVLAQARLYFADFVPGESDDGSLLADLTAQRELLSSYFAYVLLDFVNVDPDLDQLPLASTLRWAEDLRILPGFEKLLSKDLGIKGRDLVKLKPKLAELLGQPAPAP